jgi:hypothetical protein
LELKDYIAVTDQNKKSNCPVVVSIEHLEQKIARNSAIELKES